MKVPLAQDHYLKFDEDDEAAFRAVLDQIAEYMKDLSMKYGCSG